MKTERIEEPEITLVTPKVEASSCPPADGSCFPTCRPSCVPSCSPACLPAVLPRPCDPTRGAPRPPRPPGPN